MSGEVDRLMDAVLHLYVKVDSVTPLPGTDKATVVFSNGEIVTITATNLIVSEAPVRERVAMIDAHRKLIAIADLASRISVVCDDQYDADGHMPYGGTHGQGARGPGPEAREKAPEPAPAATVAPPGTRARGPEAAPESAPQEAQARGADRQENADLEAMIEESAPELSEDEERIARLLPDIDTAHNLPFKVNEPGTTGGALTDADAEALGNLWQTDPRRRSQILSVVSRQLVITLLKRKNFFPLELREQVVRMKCMDGLQDRTNVIPAEWQIFLEVPDVERTPAFFKKAAGPVEQSEEQRRAIDEIEYEMPPVSVDAGAVIAKAKSVMKSGANRVDPRK